MKSTLSKDYYQMRIPTQVDNTKLNEFFDNIDNLNLSQIDLKYGKYNIYTRDLNNDSILHHIINNSLNEKQLIKKIKLMPDVVKLINMRDNDKRTPLHLLCMKQYYTAYKTIEDILNNKSNYNYDDFNIDNIKSNETINLSFLTGGNNNIQIDYYVLDKYNRLPSSYLCEGINLTKLNKSLDDLPIEDINKKNIIINDNYLLNNSYLKYIYFYINLLQYINKRYQIKINNYTDDYKKRYTILNYEYIEFYRNEIFYNEIINKMNDKNIIDIPKQQYSKINNMTEKDYNDKIVNNSLIKDNNIFWFLISNYIYNKINKNNNNSIELLCKLKIQSILDKTNSNILCKYFNEFFNKILSPKLYLYFILCADYDIAKVQNIFNLILSIYENDIIIAPALPVAGPLPAGVTEEDNRFSNIYNHIKNEIKRRIDGREENLNNIDVFRSCFFNDIRDDIAGDVIRDIRNNNNDNPTKKNIYILFLILTIIKNIKTNEIENFNTLYNEYYEIMPKNDENNLKPILEQINLIYTNEIVEYHYDIHKVNLLNKLIDKK